MLRRQVSGGFVCLQCRLQQANAINRAGAPLFHRVASRGSSPTSTFSVPRIAQGRSRQLYSTYGAPRSREEDPFNVLLQDTQDAQPASKAPEKSQKAILQSDFETPSEPRYKKALVSSLRSVYHSRGEVLTAESASLPAEVLGKPANALIMREVKRPKKKKKKTEGVLFMEDSDFELESSGISLFQQIEQQSSELKIDDVLRNIEDLRPNEKQIVHAEFSALCDILERGFTNAQLSAYLLRHREDPSRNAYPPRLPTDPEWILERQPWIAAVENPDASLEPLLYGYTTDFMSPKQKLVALILRECWGISSYDVIAQDGYLSIKFRKEEFKLLLQGHDKWLSIVARTSPDPGTQIVVSPSIDTVSILGKPKTTEIVLGEINKILGKATTASFNATILSPEALRPAVLEEVGRITDTLVRLDKSGQEVLVTWIDTFDLGKINNRVINRPPEKRNEFENLADIVLRYLLHADDTGPRNTSSLTVIPENDKRDGRYVAVQLVEKRVSWMNRLHRWARYVKPLTEADPSESESPVETEIPTTLLEHALEIENRNEMRLDRDSRPAVGKSPAILPWPSHVKTDTKAVFGHVLHAEKPGSRLPLVSKNTALDDSRRYTFIPVHPPLRSLKFSNNLKEGGLYHAIVVLRFVPSSNQTSIAPALASVAPPLELRIEVDHKEIKRIISLRAVTGTHTRDVMLPSCPVDVRLLQTSYAELTGRSIDKYAAPVLEYLDNSNIKPWDGTLENPARLEGIEIPKHFFLPSGEVNSRVTSDNPTDRSLADQPAEQEQKTDSQKENQTPGEEGGQQETHKVDYLFASRDIQRIVAAEFDGYKISYWNINAGKLGGSTTQLCLDAICPESSRMGPDDLHRRPETFLKVVSQIASGTIGFQWIGNSPDNYVQHL